MNHKPSDEIGHVTWHSSEENGGPDVGITVNLTHGVQLWAGEVTDAAHKEAGPDAAAIDGPNGWWLIIYEEGKGETVLAKCINDEAGRALIETISEAIQRAGMQQ